MQEKQMQFQPSFWGKLEGHPANQAVSWFPSLDKMQPTQTCFYTPHDSAPEHQYKAMGALHKPLVEELQKKVKSVSV